MGETALPSRAAKAASQSSNVMWSIFRMAPRFEQTRTKCHPRRACAAVNRLQAATKKRRQEQQHDTPTPTRKAGKLGDLLAPAATVTKEQLRQRAVYGAKLLLAIKRICDLCGPKQGRILSKDARGILLIVVFMVQYLLTCSRTMAIKIVAQICHVSARCMLEPLANHWDEVGEVLVTTGSSRGVGGLNHPLATKMLQAIHLNSIDKFI